MSADDAQSGYRLELTNMGWLVGDRAVRVLGTLAINILAARTLGPPVFGEVSYAQTILAFMALGVGLGLGAVAVKSLVDEPHNARFTMGTVLSLQCFASWVLLLVAALFAIFWHELDQQSALILIMLTSLVFRPADVIRYWFEANVRSKFVVLADNAAFLVAALLKLFALLVWNSVAAFAWALVAEQAIMAVFLVLAYRFAGVNTGTWAFRPGLARQLLRNAWPLLLSGAAIAFYTRIDQVAIMSLKGAAETGIYSSAVRLSEMAYVLPTVAAASFFPRLQMLQTAEPARYSETMAKLMGPIVSVMLCLSIVTSFSAVFVTKFLYGAAYADAGPVLAVHIWTCVFVALGVFGNQWYLSHGLQRKTLAFTLLGAAVNLTANILLVPCFGALGAASASLAAQISSCLLADGLSRSTREIFLLKLKALVFPIRLVTNLSKRGLE